ncbi:MAG: hypothetical protein CMP23_15330 [Rickettsiales bacterium]|nr:hypothetical protein [Rickettsiales bacterium]
MELFIASCCVLPEPDFDAQPLDQALRAQGVVPTVLGWDDPAAAWRQAEAVLIRSTWNYPQHPEAFLRWLDLVAAHASIWNPAEVVRWNLHKGYLCELGDAGVPVTPTLLLPRHSTAELPVLLAAQQWSRAVIKPAISAGSYRTLRVDDPNSKSAQAHLEGLLRDGDVLIQRYLDSVEDYGERALVWIDGELTHAVRKSPRWAGEDESVSAALSITAAERALADAALAKVPGELLYARIDVAPGPAGAPVLMELELIEPSLFFPQHPPALTRYASSVAARLR